MKNIVFPIQSFKISNWNLLNFLKSSCFFQKTSNKSDLDVERLQLSKLISKVYHYRLITYQLRFSFFFQICTLLGQNHSVYIRVFKNDRKLYLLTVVHCTLYLVATVHCKLYLVTTLYCTWLILYIVPGYYCTLYLVSTVHCT